MLKAIHVGFVSFLVLFFLTDSSQAKASNANKTSAKTKPVQSTSKVARAQKLFLSKAVVKKLKPKEFQAYLKSVQKLVVLAENEQKGLRYGINEKTKFSIGFSVAEAAFEYNAKPWCLDPRQDDKVCYAGGYPTCRGSTSGSNSNTCQIIKCEGGGGAACNPALFGTQGEKPFCVSSADSGGYANLSAQCQAKAAAADPEGGASVPGYKRPTAEQLGEFTSKENERFGAFCNNPTSYWKGACDSVKAQRDRMVAVHASTTAEKPDGQTGDALATTDADAEEPVVQPVATENGEATTRSLSLTGVDGAAVPVEQPTAAVPTGGDSSGTGGTTSAGAVVASGPTVETDSRASTAEVYCSDKSFSFNPPKSGFVLGRYADGLNRKDKSEFGEIAKGTNCMLCGLKLACGRLAFTEINDNGLSFKEACKIMNADLAKKFENEIGAPSSACGKDATKKSFMVAWQNLKKALDKGKDNSEDAGDLKVVLQKYYEAGNAAQLFCANGPEQLGKSNVTESKGSIQSWDNKDNSPIVTVPSLEYFGNSRNIKGTTNEMTYRNGLWQSFMLKPLAEGAHRNGTTEATPQYNLVCSPGSTNPAGNEGNGSGAASESRPGG